MSAFATDEQTSGTGSPKGQHKVHLKPITVKCKCLSKVKHDELQMGRRYSFGSGRGKGTTKEQYKNVCACLVNCFFFFWHNQKLFEYTFLMWSWLTIR